MFEDLKGSVNSKVPGGIPALEKLKGQSINDFSGFNSLQGQIDSVKTQAFQKIEAEKSNVLGELNNKKVGMIAQIDKEKPRIEMYDDLPDPIKTVVRSKAEETFADQIGKTIGAEKTLVQKSGYYARSAPANAEDLHLIKGMADHAVVSALDGISGVVGHDEGHGGRLRTIEFERISGGKHFDPSAAWFQQILERTGQA